MRREVEKERTPVTSTRDDTNWIWGLDQPCPECGFDASAVPRGGVGERLRTLAERWGDLLAHHEACLRPLPGAWSTVEHACHVRDLLILFRYRLRRTLERPDPWYTKWDQDEAAVRDRYAEQDPRRVGHELVAAAERVADEFDGLGAREWTRSGRRGDGFELTVESLARYLLHDLVHHAFTVEQASHLAHEAV